ncbi:MAG: hypothetical protein NW206_20210 [Hyphomonadaceae bacterium]|nr:hypothetical protein [Hyphomonadaceae bacterium]
MRSLILALAFSSTLAACGQTTVIENNAVDTSSAAEAAPEAPAWEDAHAAGVDFRAIGQEPGWMLNIYRENKITLDWDYGQSKAEFPLTTPDTSEEGATRYSAQASGHTLAITIRRFPCNDAMSGAAFPSTVEVVIDGQTLNGCGRSV